MAKLHPDTVRLLRRYHNHGYSVVSLAEAFGLSRSCVHGVVSGKTHRNVTQDDALPPLAQIVRDKVARLPQGRPTAAQAPDVDTEDSSIVGTAGAAHPLMTVSTSSNPRPALRHMSYRSQRVCGHRPPTTATGRTIPGQSAKPLPASPRYFHATGDSTGDSSAGRGCGRARPSPEAP